MESLLRRMEIVSPECWGVFFFQAEDGIRDLVRSRGLGDVYRDRYDTILYWRSFPSDLPAPGFD